MIRLKEDPRTDALSFDSLNKKWELFNTKVFFVHSLNLIKREIHDKKNILFRDADAMLVLL